MKKNFKVVIINIIIVALLIFSFEIYMFTKEYVRVSDERRIQNMMLNQSFEQLSLPKYINAFYREYQTISKTKIEIDNNFFRQIPAYPLGSPCKSKQSPVVLLGCSYTYGDGLADKDTFSALLAEYSNREIYNLGLGGRSPRTMLYLLRDNFNYTKEEILKNNTNVQYVIYTYIPDHKRRLYVNLVSNDIPFYKKDNNHLVLTQVSLFKRTYVYKSLMELIYAYKIKYYPEDVFNLFHLYIKEINQEIKKQFHFGNEKTKFVILVYEEDEKDAWEDIKDDNIIIIKVKDLTNIDVLSPEYKVAPNDCHPNEKAWQVIVPALMKELNM